RGHGDSDPAPDGDYTVTTMAGDLTAFVDTVGLPRISLVGLSMGGRVAIAFAGTHPRRVERLVIVDIGPEIAPAGRLRVGSLMAQTPERFDDLEAALAWARATNPRYTDAMLRHRVAHGTRPSQGGLVWKYDHAIRDAVRSGQWRDPVDLWPRRSASCGSAPSPSSCPSSCCSRSCPSTPARSASATERSAGCWAPSPSRRC